MQHKGYEIVVVDYVWNGHIPTYHKYICKALLELGFKVHAINPNPDDLKEWIAATTPMYQHNITYHYWEAKQVNAQDTTSAPIANNQPGTSLTLRQRIVRWIVNNPRFKKTFEVYEMWKKVQAKVHMVATKVPQAKLFVIVPYLDAKLITANMPSVMFKRTIKYPWSGLYLHPTFFRTGQPNSNRYLNIFKSDTCKSVAVLDEGIVQFLSKKLGKKVVQFPDITNVDLEKDKLSPMAELILEKAKGRTIISLVGVLNAKKNVLTLIEAIKISAEKGLPYFFVIAGETNKFYWQNEDDYNRVVEAASLYSSNSFWHLQSIKDGQEYNSIVHVSDVLLASYKNFYHSSNTLTKAAYFQKPVIVGAGYLMQERVERYKTGQAIDGAVAENILSAIKKLTEENNAERGYNNYYAMHTYERLKQALSEMIV